MNKIKKKIIIGFSIGDYNGIGPEILLKSFHKSDLFKQCVPVIFCDEEILNFYSNKLNLKISVEDIKDIDEVNESNSFYCFKVDPENIKINPGKIDKIAGSYSIKSLENCSNALMKKSIDGMVTLPICKINSQNTRFPFPGHTEYFIKKFEVNNNIMIMHYHYVIIYLKLFYKVFSVTRKRKSCILRVDFTYRKCYHSIYTLLHESIRAIF